MSAAGYKNYHMARELSHGGRKLSACDIWGVSNLQHHLGMTNTNSCLFQRTGGQLFHEFPFENAWSYTRPVCQDVNRKSHLLFEKALQHGYTSHSQMRPPNIPQTPMALAALSGDLKLVGLLLQKGWPFHARFEGAGPDDNIDNPLIAACLGGRLNVLRFLIRYMDTQDIIHDQTLPGLFEASRSFPELQGWLLSRRYTEQVKLCSSAFYPDAGFRHWSGLERKYIPLNGPYGRWCTETMLDYAIRLRKMHENLMGKSLCWSDGSPYPYIAPWSSL